LSLLINDPETEAVVMIGEIGGQLEADAANGIKKVEAKNLLLVLSQGKLLRQVELWGMQVRLLEVVMIRPKQRRK
jgi:succinyl-CoA synthetase alpha subunit